jgi:hypothetical protein
MKMWIVLMGVALAASSAHGQVKCEASIEGFKIHNVYIVGSWYSGVAWAYKHIGEETCMNPVTDPSKADAILEIIGHNQAAAESDPGPLTVTCQSSRSSSSCLDSDGNVLTVACSGDVCSSSYGPSLASAVLGSIAQALRNAWYQSEVRLYTTDHKLIWKSDSAKGDSWHDLWPDKLREYTNSPPCKRSAFSAKRYRNYRQWASENCGVQFDPLVSIDLKLQARQDAAANQQAENREMIENAKEAAAKQKQ